MRAADGSPGADLAAWACDRLSLGAAAALGVAAAVRAYDAASPIPSHGLGLEVHHDGSGRVDVAVAAACPPGRVLDLSGVSVTAGTTDMWEYDIRDGAARLAGVFHVVEQAALPASLAGLGTPVLAAALPGRRGQVRLLLPVRDDEALARLVIALRECGPAGPPVDRLLAAAPFVTTGSTLRVGVDYQPDRDRIAARLGIEVLINPALFDVAPALQHLGVPGPAIERLRAHVARLPAARERARRIPRLPGLELEPTVDAVGFTHLSVTWDGDDVRLKSYALVTSRPASSVSQRLEALAARMSRPWPERLAWARRQLPPARPAGTASADDLAAEAPCLAEWRAAVEPAGPGAFSRRLELAGLSTQQALLVLGPLADLAPADPDWLAWFRAFRAACCPEGRTPLPLSSDQPASAEPVEDDASLRWLADQEAGWPSGAGGVPFAHLLWPGVQDAWQRLAQARPGLVALAGPGAADDLRLALLARLSEVMAPTLLADVTAELTLGTRLLMRIGDVPRDPPRAAYARRCRDLAAGGLDRVLRAHPVLPSLIGTVVRQWHAATAEMLARIAGHRDDLHREFGIPPDALLTAAAISAGDRHQDGRAVAVLRLGPSRVVYKPRDCRLEGLWADLVDRLNGLLPAPGLRAARVVAGCDGAGARYGFAEFVEQVPCADADERAAFYVDAGRTLAVLYALAATDCHHDNLVAHGPHLVLVDAEALFETRADRAPAVGPAAADEAVDAPAPTPATVLQVGMLPTWLWLEGRRTALDITALGCPPGGTELTSSRGWRAVNTDAMARGHVSVPAPHPGSLPTADGVTPDLAAHASDVVRGFEQGYRAVVAAHAAGLLDLSAAPLLARRLILRPTYVYAALLGRGLEPEALRSACARGLVLERLTRAYLGPAAERAWPLLVAEQQAMARLDVPLFQVTLDGSRTWCGDETVAVPAVGDALAAVQSRLRGLDEDDLAGQSRLIRASIAARGLRVSGTPAQAPGPHPGPPYAADTIADTAADAGLVAASAASADPTASTAPTASAASADPTADELADRCRARIVADALRPPGRPERPHGRRNRDGPATWMTPAMLPDGERVNVTPAGPGLYDGALGIALFLFERGEPSLAEAAVAPLLAELDPDDPGRAIRHVQAAGPGLLGAGGYLRGLPLLARRGHLDPASVDRAATGLIRALDPRELAGEPRLDLMSGVAGLIAPLAALRTVGRLRAEDLDRAERLVEAAADRLAAQQRPDGGWDTLPGSPPLSGVAHGASGIAVALAEAAGCLDEPRWLDSALRGLAYEQTLFDVEAGNWRDLRRGGDASTSRAGHENPGGGFMLGWCAGAPGIALARLRLLELLPDHLAAADWSADLEAAARTTAARPLLARDHLCCGNLGRAAILATLGHRRQRPDWLRAADRLVAGVLARAGHGLPRGFLGPTADVLAVPGLMTGLAGAGLQCGTDDPGSWAPDLLL